VSTKQPGVILVAVSGALGLKKIFGRASGQIPSRHRTPSTLLSADTELELRRDDDDADESDEAAGVAAATAAQAEATMREGGELPPQALDVTAACAFMVEGGQLRFHGGARQSKPPNVLLIGFGSIPRPES